MKCTAELVAIISSTLISDFVLQKKLKLNKTSIALSVLNTENVNKILCKETSEDKGIKLIKYAEQLQKNLHTYF